MAAVGAEDGHFGDQARPYGNYYQESVLAPPRAHTAVVGAPHRPNNHTARIKDIDPAILIHL